jgi:hypothetical protein
MSLDVPKTDRARLSALANLTIADKKNPQRGYSANSRPWQPVRGSKQQLETWRGLAVFKTNTMVAATVHRTAMQAFSSSSGMNPIR